MLEASVAPEVKVISAGSHLSRFATRSRACSTAAAAARPVACSVAWGLAATSSHGAMASTTRGSGRVDAWLSRRSEEHTSELQSLMRISYAVFCLKKKKDQ